ncbi:MAG: ATP-binding protein [Planctomycetota bacterium]|nr:ATP-binding protein [Planctomycetota bacterium]
MTSIAIAEEGFLRDSRNVATTLRFLVLAAAAVLGLSSPLQEPEAFWLLSCLYAATVLAPILMPRNRMSAARFGWLVFLWDVLAISAIIILRGQDMQSLLVATFTLMLLAAVIEGLGNVFINVLLVSVAFLALTRWGKPASELFDFSSLSQLALFFVTAVLMGYAAEQARHQASARRNAERKRRRAQQQLVKTSHHLHHSEEQLEEAQQSLRANERLYTLGLLSAGVSHELKNPIAVIVAGVEVAEEITQEVQEQEQPPRDAVEDLAAALSECRLACDQLHRIVGDLNNLARAGEIRTTGVDLATSIDIAARLLRKLAGDIGVEVQAPAVQAAMADPGRVLQVILNLGKNALDAMHEHGGTSLLLACRDAGEHVELLVRDDGPGIPPDLQARMFEPFVSTKGPGKGTGLGLHLVREIVTSHCGTVECESQPGAGTLFRVRLPVSSSNPERD